MIAPRKTRHILGIDALRFIASILVMFYHLGFWIWAGHNVDVSYRWPMTFSWFGHVGVEIFFTISGFVIAYTAEPADGISFFRGRAARLLPGSIACSTITTGILLISGKRHLLHEWINSAVILPKGPWIDGSYWTLPIELSFYTVVFLLLLLNLKRFIPAVVGTIGLLSSAIWIALTAANQFALLRHSDQVIHWTSHWIYILSTREDVFLTLIPHGCFFAEGEFLWLCLFKRPTRGRIAVMAFCAVGGITETLNHAILGLEAAFNSSHPGWPYHPAIPCLAWIISVVALYLSVRKNDWISNLFGKRAGWLRQAGLLTYPLYLLHQSIGFAMISGLRSHVSDSASLLIACATIMMLSFCVARFVEPFLKDITLWLIPANYATPRLAAETSSVTSTTTKV